MWFFIFSLRVMCINRSRNESPTFFFSKRPSLTDLKVHEFMLVFKTEGTTLLLSKYVFNNNKKNFKRN